MTSHAPAPSYNPQRLVLLGSTGSIGTQTLEVLSRLGEHAPRVVALAAGGSRLELLARQAITWEVPVLAVTGARGGLGTLWEIRSGASEQLGLPPVRLCVGDQTDTPEHHLDRKVGKRGACQLGAFKRVGINWVADSTCKDSRTTIVSQSTVTGDFQSHYRIDTVILYSPPLANNRREDREYTEARWLGPCPDNQKPADLTIPGMGVLNMLDGGLRPESAGQR